jgi:hypothetical protein
VRQEPEQENFLGIVVYRANKPVTVAANVKYHDRIAAGHSHLIRRTKAPPQIGEMRESLASHDPPPGFQTRCRLRMLFGKSHNSGFLN